MKKYCKNFICFLVFLFISFSSFCRESMNGRALGSHGSLIVIDPGHGGKDLGTASTREGYEEKSLNLATAVLVQSQLRRLGYKVLLTRQKDTYVSLLKRSEMANSQHAKIFVSIHYNYSQNASALGTEIYYYGEKKFSQRASLSKCLGEEILRYLKTEAGIRSRGTKTGNFSVIRETKMPAVLIEVGFLSNPKEREKLLDPRYRMKIAKGVASGIHTYLHKIN